MIALQMSAASIVLNVSPVIQCTCLLIAAGSVLAAMRVGGMRENIKEDNNESHSL